MFPESLAAGDWNRSVEQEDFCVNRQWLLSPPKFSLLDTKCTLA